MADQIQRNSIAFPLETRYNNASSSPTPGSDPNNPRNMVPPINTVPLDYPTTLVPGKIEKLYIANNQKILTRFTGKTDYANSLLRFGPRQPFVWYNPNEGESGTNAIKKYDSRAFPIGSTLQDVVRISKYSVSGNGVIFLLKQSLLQNLQPFNETNVYNPLMPIIAAIRPGSLGLLPRPTRHIDLSGGILGGLASVVGFSVNNGRSSPKGTVGDGIQDDSDNSPLSKQSIGGGKGLLRGKTASGGYNSLASRWGGNAEKNILRSIAASVFPSLINSKQPEKTGYRADEGAYGWMISDKKGKFNKHNVITNAEITLNQLWIAGSSDGGPKNIRKDGNEAPQNRRIVFIDGTEQKISGTDVTGPTINGGTTGFKFEKDVDNVEKYGKSVGIEPYRKDTSNNFKFSVMLMNYKKFLDKTNKFPTKMDGPPLDLTNANDTIVIKPQEDFFKKYGFDTVPQVFVIKTMPNIPTRQGTGDEKRSASAVDGTYSKNRKDANDNGNLSNFHKNMEDGKFKNVPSETNDVGDRINSTLQSKKEDPVNKKQIDNLNKLVDNIKKAGYSVAFTNADTRVFTSPNTTLFGTDKLKQSNINDKMLVDDYKDNTQLLDGMGKHARINSRKMATSNTSDGLNRLTIIGKDKKIKDDTGISGWSTYEPYNDDLIAFYFYDMINEKYIPFRASVTGINDSFQAEWANYNYIGRADKLYTYSGITRQLSFSFKVIANSIKELLPMWTRVNYLCGLTMPANYTSAPSQGGGSENQFIIPAFVLLTLGEMYKEQPIIINRVGLSIPEGSSWETVSENSEQDWSYLNNIITWNSSKGKVAQFPREVEVSVDLTPLFKERPVTGMANFGHAPRDLKNIGLVGGFNNEFSEALTVNRV
jgi:hypothetical protein